MSKESLEQFMEKVGSNEELRASIENQLDSDGNISVDALIAFGAENGCEFTTEDLTQNVELSDEELDAVAGGSVTLENLAASAAIRAMFAVVVTTTSNSESMYVRTGGAPRRLSKTSRDGAAEQVTAKKRIG